LNEDVVKIIDLFEYLKSLKTIKKANIKNYNKQLFSLDIKEFRIKSEYLSYDQYKVKDDVILEIKKPTFDKLEVKDDLIKDFTSDYSDFEVNLKYNKSLDDNPEFKKWFQEYQNWRQLQLEKQAISKLFLGLYKVWANIEREENSLELLACNGLFSAVENPEVKHPIFMKRIKMQFDVKTNTIKLLNLPQSSFVYLELLQEFDDLNFDKISDFSYEVEKENYHPFDLYASKKLLDTFIHTISMNGLLLSKNTALYDEKYTISNKPMLILRKRYDASTKAISKIIDDIKKKEEIPQALHDLIIGGKKLDIIKVPSLSFEEKLARINGESKEILLTKEANAEQLEIAEKIASNNAVIVEGPPGTGKTHTIANLIGHFLANNQKVLVSASTSKALRVIKNQINPSLRDLIVSILDDDFADLENSIDGIADKLHISTSADYINNLTILENQRSDLLNALIKQRKNIYNLKNQEYEKVQYGLQSYYPYELANFVNQNKENLEYIPGQVQISAAYPLTKKEFKELYSSNKSLSAMDERELANNIVDVNKILNVNEFKNLIEKKEEIINDFNVFFNKEVEIDLNTLSIGNYINDLDENKLNDIDKYVSSFSPFKDYMIDLITADDYKKEQFIRLKDYCSEIYNLQQKFNSDIFGHKIEILNENYELLLKEFLSLKDIFENKGRIGKLDLMIKRINNYQNILFDHRPVRTLNDCLIIIDYLKILNGKEKIINMFNQTFEDKVDLDFNKIEEVYQFVESFPTYLTWLDNNYESLLNLAFEVGYNNNYLFNLTSFSRSREDVKEIENTIINKLVNFNKISFELINLKEIEFKLNQCKEELDLKSSVNLKLAEAIDKNDIDKYSMIYNLIFEYNVKKGIYQKRMKYLNKLSYIAFTFSEKIRNREGIYGSSEFPENFEDLWKYKQFSQLIQNINSSNYEQIQVDNEILAQELKDVTSKLVNNKAWYNILKKSEEDTFLQQSLLGYKLTMKKMSIGKNRNSSLLKNEASRLMAKCQEAIPIWIMPISKALEILDPTYNKFDVIIIDEASQADISSLALLYMAKKIIIVGDDNQVSPSAIGLSLKVVNNLKATYIENKILNWHLYDATTSLYDLALTTFKPLILLEHFRCAPRIIRYSNQLAYNNVIRPLKSDYANPLSPSVKLVKVDGVKTEYKTNVEEAKEIIKMVQEFLLLEEYHNMTIGIISLLGDNQVRLIEKLLINRLDPRQIEKHQILVGNASNFQGDERDVIFLSLVDSNEDEMPLKFKGNGNLNVYKQRFNVAVSRAKNQLIVVTSLNYRHDLQESDIRRGLLEFASNDIKSQIEAKEYPLSSFETELYQEFLKYDFKVTKKVEVGSYIVDFVIENHGVVVAIECEGLKTSETVEKSLEKQVILTRLGWNFAYIRASEYYANPQLAIEKLLNKLKSLNLSFEENNILN